VSIKDKPTQVAFGVTFGKFLGIAIHHMRIEIDQSKIKAIQDMHEPKNLNELRGLQGSLAYI